MRVSEFFPIFHNDPYTDKMIMEKKFKYIYGPVHSWRLGYSLGVDPLACREKICNLDCVYCQLGKTQFLCQDRQVFVPAEEIISEMWNLPPMNIDYVTISGRGEPTLAQNLGEIILRIRHFRRGKIAVITNSALINRQDVQDDLSFADYVVAKLDACNQSMFLKIDKAPQNTDFGLIIQGLQDFRNSFPGKLAIQVMFVHENQNYAREIAQLIKMIGPDEIHLDTPLRPCGIKPLSPEEMEAIKVIFYLQGLKTASVYDMPTHESHPIDTQATRLRHGNYQKQIIVN